MENHSSLLEINPVLPSGNMHRDIEFYEGKLGFKKVFDFKEKENDPSTYAVLWRENTAIHLQYFPDKESVTSSQIRIRVKHIETLYREYKEKGVIHSHLEAKPWGTRDFGLYDPSMNALVFFENLE